jgi:hypothetical protein
MYCEGVLFHHFSTKLIGTKSCDCLTTYISAVQVCCTFFGKVSKQLTEPDILEYATFNLGKITIKGLDL